MPTDLDGVRRGVVDPATFLEDAYANWEQQVEMTLQLMADPSWDLLMTHLFTADNVQHLFWHCQDPQHPAYQAHQDRFADEIERAYRWLDAQLGRLLERVDAHTAVIVVSDHGGLPVYRLFYLNAWLLAHGYLFPRERRGQGTASRLDWTRTRAAMFGTGGIWLNVQGREPRGNVPPGAAYEALRQEIAQALYAWPDPQTGQPVVKRVLFGEEVWGPQARESGPDLIPALQPGYGLGRGEGLGQVMLDTPPVVPNPGPWSGGHEGPYLPSDVPGIYVLSRGGPPCPPRRAGSDRSRSHEPRPDRPEPRPDRRAGTEPRPDRPVSLHDIAPTALHLLGIENAAGMEGRSLVSGPCESVTRLQNSYTTLTNHDRGVLA
jgi:hypothetical protein